MLFRTAGLGWRHLSFPDMAVEAGRFTFIAGPSGCGKSMLLKMLNGVLTPERGELYCEDRPIQDWDYLERRRRYLLAGQQVYLLPGSVADNFAGFYAYRHLQAPDTGHMRRYLDICCADWDISADCASLSGGERQRVYLAIFLSFASPVLLLDEPTAALDRDTGRRLMTNLRAEMNARRGSFIAVSHDAQLTEEFAEDVVMFGDRS